MPRNGMVRVTVRIPAEIVEDIEYLDDQGYYANRSDVIRDACRRLIIELGGDDRDIDVSGPGRPPAALGGRSHTDSVPDMLPDPKEEVEKRRQWREEAAANGSEPENTWLDHSDPEDLQTAYEEADGCIADAAERFAVTYQTVRYHLIDAGIHEPQERGSGQSERVA